MGAIIGAGISAAGSLIGGQQSAKAAKESAQIQAAAADRAGERALTGYNYVTSGPGAAPMQSYVQGGQRALGQQANVQNLMQDLLGIPVYNEAVQAGQPAQAGPTAGAPQMGGQQPQAAPPGNVNAMSPVWWSNSVTATPGMNPAPGTAPFAVNALAPGVLPGQFTRDGAPGYYVPPTYMGA